MATISSNPWDQYHASVRGRAGGATQIGDCLEIILDSEKMGRSALTMQIAGISSSTPPSIELYAYQRQVKAANDRVWAQYERIKLGFLNWGKKSFSIHRGIHSKKFGATDSLLIDTATLKEINFLGSEKDRMSARSALSNHVPVPDLVSLIKDYYPILKDEANWILSPNLHPCYTISHYNTDTIVKSLKLPESFEPIFEDRSPPSSFSVSPNSRSSRCKKAMDALFFWKK